MAIDPEADGQAMAKLCAIADAIDQAEHGAKVADVIAAEMGISRVTLYRKLAKIGWRSGRKCRSDRGATRQDLQAAALVAALQHLSVRETGKITLPATVAVSLAKNNGIDISVSTSRLRELHRAHHMDPRTQRLPRPHVRMRSLHPNHVHQVDPSLCLLYYAPGKGQGIIDERALHRNKLPKAAEIRHRVWRYVLWDHYSSVVVPYYIEAAGENQIGLFDALMWAWGEQAGCPFHGVPKLMIWDKGSANTSAGIRSLLAALEVEAIPHAVGNPRGKGGVESANNLVETQFESLLRFEPVVSVAALNQAAHKWADAYNANMIPHQDTRLKRDGIAPIARYDLWLRIRPEELRLLPPREVCERLLRGKTERRKVTGNMEIEYRHPATPKGEPRQIYSVRGIEGITKGQRIEVIPLMYGGRAILARVEGADGEPRDYRLEPVEFDGAGMSIEAPVFGQSYKSQPDTPVERAGKYLDTLAFPGRTQEQIKRAKAKRETPFEGQLTAHSHLGDIERPSYLPKQGTSIYQPQPAQVVLTPITLPQAWRHIRHAVGEAGPTYDALRAQWPEGIPEEALERLIEELRAQSAQAAG